MSQKMKSFIVLAVVVIAGAALAYYLSGRSDTNVPTVRIAANLPLSGPLATYGVAVREGSQMRLAEAREDVNSNGRSPTFFVDWQDNAGDPKSAVTILQRQLLSNPVVYISGVKPQTMAIKAEVSSAGIPHFVWIFDAVINQGAINTFRTWVSYKIEPQVYLQYAKARGSKRIAITYVQLPHTVDEFQRIVEPEMRQMNAALDVHPYEFGKTDFRDIALKIAAFKPDLIILNGFQSDLVGLIRALRPFRLITDGNTIATYDLLDAAKILGPDEIEGLRVVAPQFELLRDNARIAEWRRRFTSQFRHEPLYTSAFAYDMMTAIMKASQSIPLPSPPTSWIDALRKLDIEGITGPIRFDADGDMVTPLSVGVYRNGKLETSH